MNSTEQIKQEAKEVVLGILPDVSSEDLNEESDIFSLGLDSINAMTLVSNLQDAFDIQLETNEINFENFQNLASIIEMVEKKKGLKDETLSSTTV
jgi:acyl carrier protein